MPRESWKDLAKVCCGGAWEAGWGRGVGVTVEADLGAGAGCTLGEEVAVGAGCEAGWGTEASVGVWVASEPG